MTTPKKVVYAQCEECGGTGLYEGFMEQKGYPVVCLGCEGSGRKKIVYVEFTHRRRRAGVKAVRISRGTFIATGVGAVGKAMSYAEFQKRFKDPARKRSRSTSGATKRMP